MCRLFAMTTGGPRVETSFWLLESSSSLTRLSHQQPDGTGLGWFSLGDEPVRDRAPVAAFENDDFASAARHVISHTFVSHIRYATTGALDVHNTHPFDINDRLFAHNGLVQGLDLIDSWLTDVDRAHVEGSTDSELVFAFITAQIKRHGDTTTGLIEAVRRLGARVPIFSLNLVLAEPRKLWALRYPDNRELWALSPEGGGFGSTRSLGTGDVRLEVGPKVPAYLVASQPLDDDPDWRLLEPGELLIVDGLEATSLFPFDEPARTLRLEDLTGADGAFAFHPEGVAS
ncbi:class II glutamine amidotransferase [Actinomadura barringtoniae]|uniref:Class II glutamine amidotransferase n=1 Tax=Actinomadura barringtoniae TaxID=1427535 RepID=A0A939PEA2_9ACTN|nr:class II glutamine amidotransferase [Actinomadura barringtoniae]MBO2450733.1 class II glutamine amidotransferase [Actinomadura barringtoniae]